MRDIIERNNISNVEELNELLNVISSQIGSLTNPFNLQNTFKSKKNVTLSEDDWCDLSKEFANEIVGHAKMKLNEKKGDEFSLGIPEYLGRVDFAHFKLDKSATFDIEGSSFRIGYKKDE